MVKKKKDNPPSFFQLTLILCIILFIPLMNGCSKETPGKNTRKLRNATQVNDKTMYCVSLVQSTPGHQWKRRIVDEQLAVFDFENPSIKLNAQWETSESLDAYIDGLVKDLKHNPRNLDVIPMSARIYETVAQKLKDPDWGKKYLVDFLQYPEFIKSHRPNIFENKELLLKTGSILTGPYLQGYYFSTMYNAELGQKIGIELPGSQLLFEDLLNAIEKINRYNQTAAEPIYAISALNVDYPARVIFLSLLLSAITDEYGYIPNKISEEKQKEAILTVLKQLRRLAELKPFIPKDKLHTSRNITQLNLLNNRAVFYFYCMVKPENYEKFPIAKTPTGLRLLELPVLKPLNYTLAHFSASWAVVQKSPNVEAGIKLMNHWTKPEIAEMWTQASRNITGLCHPLYTAKSENDTFGMFLSEQDNKHGDNVLDLTSSVIFHYTLFEFPYKKTLPLYSQLANDKLTDEHIMNGFLRRK